MMKMKLIDWIIKTNLFNELYKYEETEQWLLNNYGDIIRNIVQFLHTNNKTYLEICNKIPNCNLYSLKRVFIDYAELDSSIEVFNLIKILNLDNKDYYTDLISKNINTILNILNDKTYEDFSSIHL